MTQTGDHTMMYSALPFVYILGASLCFAGTLHKELHPVLRAGGAVFGVIFLELIIYGATSYRPS